MTMTSLSCITGILCVMCVAVSRSLELVSSSVRCERDPRVLQGRQGEIRSSTHHSWSSRLLNCSWLIPAPMGEPVILSFSQFSVRCSVEWVSVTSSEGATLTLCGSQLPRPMELLGGNISVTHHFLQHIYPPSTIRLSYIRGSAPCAEVEFECRSGRCLPASWRCNGQSECLGEGREVGSDEQGCERGRPPAWDGRGLGVGPTAAVGWRQPLSGPCGGLLTGFYGWFSPPVLAGPPLVCVWSVDPQDPRPLRLKLQLLELGPGDTVSVTDQLQGQGTTIKTITCTSNYKVVEVESRTGLLSLTYRMLPGSEGRGFNATYRMAGYCLLRGGEGVCGGSDGECFSAEQRCDGRWDCVETGRDEQGCWGCPPGEFACGVAGARGGDAGGGGHFIGHSVCFPAKERCNYQLYCADGSDERACTTCQPGTFHCDTDRCVFESWRCDGQVDCKDGTDEVNCTVTLPRKVITAATLGSLVCGLLLVIAMGCTCKLYSLRTREYSMFAPITRQEAALIQQQAPPSYGQLIAQGVIPPVEDFPTENPNESPTLSLRGLLQLLGQDRGPSSRRRRRPRFVRRAVRRMRRWGLLPRSASRPAQPASPSLQPEVAFSTGSEPSQSSPGASSLAGAGASSALPQKLALDPPTELPTPPAPPSQNPPPAPPQAPPPAMPSGSMLFASLFHTLGLSISLFRPSPSSPPLSSFSSSEDDVLLIPLSEDTLSEEDVPMLT